jgi:hypothetical protein
MSQQELQAAIVSLDASTAAIQKQGEILKAQQQYLDHVKGQRLERNHGSRAKQLAIQNLSLTVGNTRIELLISHQLFAGERRP